MTARRYVIYCLDKDDGEAIRDARIDDHRSHIVSAKIRILLAGPIMSDQHDKARGSLFIVEADSLEQVEAFNAADPFRRAGLWKSVAIHPFSIARHSLA